MATRLQAAAAVAIHRRTRRQVETIHHHLEEAIHPVAVLPRLGMAAAMATRRRQGTLATHHRMVRRRQEAVTARRQATEARRHPTAMDDPKRDAVAHRDEREEEAVERRETEMARAVAKANETGTGMLVATDPLPKSLSPRLECSSG